MQAISNDKRLYDCSVDWQMRFNTDKCKTLHFGYANVRTEYLLGDEVVTTDEKEKDLGLSFIRH